MEVVVVHLAVLRVTSHVVSIRPHCRSTVVCKAQASQGAKVVKNISQQAAVLAASTLIAGVRVADHSEGFTLPMD